MTSSSKTLLLSIRPEYTELILAGSKTIELRRRPPRAPPGTLVIMYASAPTCALVGAFVMTGVVARTPASLWADYGEQTGVTRHVFMDYFAGRETAFGLEIGDVWPLDAEVSLNSLRRLWGGFHPPQSYRYLQAKKSASSVCLRFEGQSRDFVLPGSVG